MSVSLDKVRTLLLSPSKESKDFRKEIADEATRGKVIALLTGAGGGVVGAIGLFASRNYPILGGMLFVAGAIVALASRETFVWGSNIERMCDGNLAQRIRSRSALTADEVVNQGLEGTWIIKPLAGNYLKRKLE